MIALLAAPLVSLVLFQVDAGQIPPEIAVAAVVDDLRQAELLLDASAMEPYVAASFVLIEEETRLKGSFAFLEPIRRLRERGGEVRELRFDAREVRVVGTAAVVTYRYTKAWKEDGARRRESGWCTDVLGFHGNAWLLVARHRAADRRQR